MNISLIIPPSPFLLDEKVFPALGILKVASALQKTGYNVQVVDLSGDADYLNTVVRTVIPQNPDVIGITSTTPQFPFAMRVSHALRTALPTARLIIGGGHPTLVHASVKKSDRALKNWKIVQDNFDTVVVGDGELSCLQAVLPDAPAMINADDPASSLFLNNASLSDTAFPARELIDLNSYHYYLDGKRTTSLIGQLGCPFSCGFCSGRSSPMLRRIRMRSVDNIVEEILHIHLVHGCEGFMFYDDELNLNNAGTIGLMKRLIELKDKGFDFRYRGCIKSQLLTDEQAKHMAAAGFSEVLVGFESGNDKILTNINKKASKADNERCIGFLKKYGIKCKFLMSIGHPGESDETCQDTYEWLLKMRPDFFDVTIITAQPGSPYYDDSILTNKGWAYTCKSGDVLYTADLDYSVDVDYYKGAIGKYKSYVSTDYLTSDQLTQWRDFIESSVRSKIGIPYPTAKECFDRSMGQ
jgi:anaerobic magnesium-protoporphyrin IX monomethyl ester cyclase